MQDELKNLADLYYARVVEPSVGVNINWIRRAMLQLGIKDESVDNLYMINAPMSREVWYYTFVKVFEEKKLADFLNMLIDTIGALPLGNLASSLDALGIYYDGKYHAKVFNIAVLVSGRGTNLQALIDAIDAGKINGRIVAVISNRKNAKALERANKHGIESFYVPVKKQESRESYDKKLAEIIDERNVNLIVLAGFLRILSHWFVEKYKNKIINIHPSLLPAFAGLYGEDVHRAVLEYGCKVTGCTVHYVDSELDHGPVIVQRCVPINDDDSVQKLAMRVLEKEHECLVEAVKLIAEGRVEVRGRKVLKR